MYLVYAKDGFHKNKSVYGLYYLYVLSSVYILKAPCVSRIGEYTNDYIHSVKKLY